MVDDLDKYIIERDKQKPGFAKQVESATRRQLFARQMATKRQAFLEAVAQGQADLEAGYSLSDEDMGNQLDETFGALKST